MRVYARVDGGEVRELVELNDAADITKRFHPSLTFVEVTGRDPMPAVGWGVADGAFTPPPAPVVDLEALRGGALATVDGDAERARLQFITRGDGQTATYLAKQGEVERWRAAGAPADVAVGQGYTWAEKRAARRGAPVGAVLAEWGARVDAWTDVGQRIEDIREQAKEDIAAATDAPEIEAILAALVWPTP